MSNVNFDVEGNLAIVTINRPEARNAVDNPTAIELATLFRKFDADDSLSVAILTGADGYFCAGADLKTMHSNQRDERIAKRHEEVPDLHWQSLLRHNRPRHR